MNRASIRSVIRFSNADFANLHAQAKSELQQIWKAETKNKDYKAFDEFSHKFQAKYPKAVVCLKKDKEELLAFYNYPAEHWKSLRTANPMEIGYRERSPKLFLNQKDIARAWFYVIPLNRSKS